MNVNKFFKATLFGLVGVFIFLVTIYTAMATSTDPTFFNYTLNMSQLPFTNLTVPINFTSNENFTNITVGLDPGFVIIAHDENFTNVSATSFEFLGYTENLTMDNKTSAVFNFNFSIPGNVTSNTTYAQGFVFNFTGNNTQQNVTFIWNIVQDPPSTIEINYNGTCELLDAVSYPVYNYTFNASDLPQNVSKCFAASLSASQNFYVVNTSRVFTNLTNITSVGNETYDFNITVALENMYVNASSIEFLETAILFGDVSRIITFDFIVTNTSIEVVNDTSVDASNGVCDIDDDSTLSEVQACIDFLDNETVQQKVRIINDTRIEGVPVNEEAMLKWLDEHANILAAEKQHQIDVYETELDVKNKQNAALTADKNSLISENDAKLAQLTTNFTGTLEDFKKKEKLRFFAFFGILSILVGGLVFKKWRGVQRMEDF